MGGTIYTHCIECGETFDKVEGTGLPNICQFCALETQIEEWILQSRVESGLPLERLARAIRSGIGDDLEFLIKELQK